MQKMKSFSEYGKTLQRSHQLKNDPQYFRTAADRFQKHPLKLSKSEPKFVQGFDRITGRSRPSSFQIATTPVFNSHANYDVKQNLIKTNSTFLPLRQQQSQRLKNIMVNSNGDHCEPECKRHKNYLKNDIVLTTRDLHKFRKSYHSIDFSKQSSMSHTYIKKSVANQETLQSLYAKKRNSTEIESFGRKTNVHSFNSYTKRDFLSSKKLSLVGAPPHSGSDCFKIALDKFKGGLKSVQSHQFSRSSTKRF